MATEFDPIKIEGLDSENAENVTEIQSYLDTFNKEIQSTDGTTITQLTGDHFTFEKQIFMKLYVNL